MEDDTPKWQAPRLDVTENSEVSTALGQVHWTTVHVSSPDISS